MKEEAVDPRMERVIRYVEGDLDAGERLAFEADMAADPALKEEVEAARRTIGGLRTLGEERLRAELKAADEQVTERAAGGTGTWWWAAAAILVLCGLAWWLVPTPSTPQELAAEFAIIEPGLPVLMGTSPRTMDAIMNAYKQENFGTARGLLELALERDPQNDTLRYFNGVLEEREKGCASAEVWFAHVPDSSVFAAKAVYNSALCALRHGDLSRAREGLGRVLKMSDTQLSAKARDLLLRLEKM